jgi:hypothetical protein
MNFDRLTLVYNEACYGGRLKIDGTGILVEGEPGQQGMVFDGGTHSDITLALRLDNNREARIYHGWWDAGWSGLTLRTSFQKWSYNIWTQLHDGVSIHDAVIEAIVHAIDDGDYSKPLSALPTYRLRGQGEIHNVYLKSLGI